jgi:hypothetical protein
MPPVMSSARALRRTAGSSSSSSSSVLGTPISSKPVLLPRRAATTSSSGRMMMVVAANARSPSPAATTLATLGRRRRPCLAPPPRASAADDAAGSGDPSSRPSASSGQDDDAAAAGGAFDGDAARALKEAAALDELIDVLLAARTQQEMAQLVAQNVLAFDTKFWLRVATRADAAPDEPTKERLRDVADSVVALLDAAMKQTETRLSDSARVLQEVLAAAADADGQWYLPLSKAQVASVRAALDERSSMLDEALLSNAFAWIRKCNEDGLDSMAQLIQKVLQLYAARALSGGGGQDAAEAAAAAEQAAVAAAAAAGSYLPPSGRDQAAARVLEEVIAAEEHEWESIIERSATEGVAAALAGGARAAAGRSSSAGDADGPLAEAAFSDALQRKMEETVLGLTSGSYAQRVQAEYLKEIEGRARSVFRRLAGAA